MRKSIYVLHERSSKEHFIALESYALSNNLEIKYREFLILSCFVKSILRLDNMLFFQQLKNIHFFIMALFSKKKTIIIGSSTTLLLDAKLAGIRSYEISDFSGHCSALIKSLPCYSIERFLFEANKNL